MQRLMSGYNLVERDLLGKKFEDVEGVTSIIEFLRSIRQGVTPTGRLKVVGLENLLAVCQDRESTGFIRRTLSSGSNWLLQRGTTILFPVERVTMDTEPKLIFNREEIRLRPIFGNRLMQRDAGYFYASFNIG